MSNTNEKKQSNNLFADSKDNIAIDKMPPQNIEAEQSVIGSLLIDKDAIIRVADILTSKDFYKKTHQIIYQAIVDLYQKQEPVDILSLSSRLQELNKLQDIGGKAYLTTLANSVVTPIHALNYAKIVQKKRILRDLISASYDIGQLGYQESEDIESLLDVAEQKILSISQDSLPSEFMSIKPFLDSAFERIERLHHEKGTLRGVSTGFPKLDNILAGLQKSDLIILAARPSLGKTSLALDIARHVGSKLKIPVGIFSLEMSREQLIDRFLAAEARVDLWKLRTGNLSYEGEYNDFMRIRDAMANLAEAPIFIEDAASPNIMQMRTMARRLQAENKLGLIVVDYLQLMLPRTHSDNIVQQITEISRSLKALARELNVPVLALSQLSRAVEHRTGAKIPRLADLRESGSLEQDADVVLFIYREDRDKENSEKTNMAKIIIAKHRNGPTGDVELYFNETRASFETPTDREGEAGE